MEEQKHNDFSTSFNSKWAASEVNTIIEKVSKMLFVDPTKKCVVLSYVENSTQKFF